MVSAIDQFILAVAVGSGAIAGFLGGWHAARNRYLWRGQLLMKEKVRRELSDNIAAKNIAVVFRGEHELSAEQLLQFMCYGTTPDPKDETRGFSVYAPH